MTIDVSASQRAPVTEAERTGTARAGGNGADRVVLERLLAALEDLRDGNFRRRLPVTGNELSCRLSEVFNEIAERNQSFTGQLIRLHEITSLDGQTSERISLNGERGGWALAISSVNDMIDDLQRPVTELSRVLAAVADGDLSVRMPRPSTRGLKGKPDGEGELDSLSTTVNDLLDKLSLFAEEVTRVAREIGTEGRLGGQAVVPGVAGTWRDLTDSVNFMAANLTDQVRDVSRVAKAVAQGDLSAKISVEVSGEMLELKSTINTMVDQLSAFADEVTRVAREVGSDGRLGGQARVPGAAGTWRDLTDSVNFMAANLTDQVRNIAQVATAVARGDLSQKIEVDARGEILALKNTINTMVDQLSAFADEVTRVAREVGTEGRLGGQAQVPGVAGTWRDLTDSVNFMAANLTSQVRSIAQVTTAVARGDLSQKIEVDARGEILALKNTINTMVDQLSAFADEVTRVAREVGTEGKLGGQAQVPGVAGTWRDLTDSVNFMAANLTAQVRNIAQVTTAVANGDLTQMITVDARGEILELKETINRMVDRLSAFADEVTRVAREVGTEGKLGGRARVRGVAGTWKDLTDNVNIMAENLTSQVRSIATVASAVAGGDMSKKITVEAKGEVAALAETINGMVDTLRAFADEVTRVAREVGTEGILGGQARVPNVAGTWKDLTDNVNYMAHNLTSQVRNIAQVTTAVAQGDLSKKIDVDARGEMLELKNTINTMVDQLSAFASEVTRVAREVGTEGKLGGQAEVAGVSGMWQRLTESVNHLAGNLTTQVRAIAAVATAVTAGDLTRQITVDASGEVAELKDNINQMIANLRETTRANREQDWLKTNLARISGLMQGHHDLKALASLIMSELAPLVSAQAGAFYLANTTETGDVVLERTASYGMPSAELVNGHGTRFKLGESLVGQAAADKKTILMLGAPNYIRISSGLGSVTPVNVILVPVLFEGQTLGVIELASVNEFTEVQRDLLEQLKETIGVNVNTIVANSRTEALLAESQRLAQELQARSEELQQQQEELQRSNTELAEKAALLASQNRDIEIKNTAIEQASRELEERARQLALASTYKSEFLANMSHELRTPLNSTLILSKLLADNREGNLTPQQVEFARTIHSACTDLLQMINDVLDLAKVEAGRMELFPLVVPIEDLAAYVESLYQPIATDKGLEFTVDVSPDLPQSLYTDRQRLQQILRNLLSNAMKFTHEGRVRLRIRPADASEVKNPALKEAPMRVAFVVEDTGIGIPADKLTLIFEAFQQADGTTSRKYGGTGLGLSICRELTRLLGGELQVSSVLGQGSTFTLYLPAEHCSSQAALASDRVGSVSATPDRLESVSTSDRMDTLATGADVKPGEAQETVKGVSSWRKELVSTPESGAKSELPPRSTVRFNGERILVVDDDPRYVYAITTALEQHGLNVMCVDNGVAGIRVLEQNPDIRLVLMDIMMPELDGNATIAAIRRTPKFRDLPLIAVTAKAMKGDREECLAWGASDYITKPIDIDHLLERIAEHLRCGAASVPDQRSGPE